VARIAGTVVEVHGGRAWVECRAEATGCNACASGRGCSWRATTGSRRVEVDKVLDGRALEAGEAVELEADEAALFAAALRLYLPPLAGLLAGPALLRGLGGDVAAWPALAAALGLLLGCLVARRWTRAVPAPRLHRP
jgi:positive regulator of sigma E activity